MEILSIGQISPDQVIYWQRGGMMLNATLVYTWLVMALFVAGSVFLTRGLVRRGPVSRRQLFLETVMQALRQNIRDLGGEAAVACLPFISTLFLFIFFANILAIIPGFVSPTASLTTTAALAFCVFIAVPLYGIRRRGLWRYLRAYAQPNIFFFPLHLISETARTIALAVRLFGNIMSHEKIIGILLSVVPLFFPAVMQVLGLIIGTIQAYIFAVLATVYIAAALNDAADDAPRRDDIKAAPTAS